MKKKVLNLIDLGINVFVVIATIISIISYFNKNGNEPIGAQCFRYFTILSNIFFALTSIVMSYFNFKVIIDEEKDIKWFKNLRFASVCGVTLTMMTVFLYLIPITSFKMMLQYTNLFMHLINPLFAVISFLLLEIDEFKWQKSFIGLIPMVVYGTIYFICVVIVKCWPDFYCFTGNIIASIILMLTGISVISFGLVLLRKLIQKHI